MLFITVMFVGMGTILFVMGGYYLHLGKLTEDWRPVDAKVLQKGTAMTRGAGGKVQTHKYFIFYEYEVNGKKYQSGRISFKAALIPTYKQEEKYAGVTHLKAYYDPQHHERAVIEKGVDSANYMTFFAALFFIGVGIANWLWG